MKIERVHFTLQKVGKPPDQLLRFEFKTPQPMLADAQYSVVFDLNSGVATIIRRENG